MTPESPSWQPTAERIAEANLTRFGRFVSERYGVHATDYSALWQWSVQYPDEFWPAVWDFCGIIGQRGDRVLLDGDRMPGARWFPDARLNFAENLLRRRDDHTAIVFWNEAGRQTEISYSELYAATARLAAFLVELDVRAGDRVAALLPNMPETIVAMLATASLGAVFSSCSPDFGVAGAIDRFGQNEPRVLFAVDGYRYGGKQFPVIEKVAAVVQGVPSIEATIMIPYLDSAACPPSGSGWRTWSALQKPRLEQDSLDPSAGRTPEFLRLPFDHPLYILYSSGTTGPPKCIVHGAGGTLLQHVKEHVLHTDLKSDDRLFYFTTTGWMMWNWLVSGLASGCTLLLYDGSPMHTDGRILWDLAEAERMTIFGGSAKYFAAIEKADLRPAETHRLDSLRTVLSTGSPLAAESFDYVARHIGSDICLSSISGGTDIISCFVLGNPLLPVYRGEIQCRGLGMKVEVFDERGHSVVGSKGELVCSAPFPSQPVGFWQDPDGSRYRTAYFERFPGVWCHGDYMELTPRGGAIIHGRSDAVLNPGGVRIGTAEIYRQVEQLPEVLESIAVGQPWEGDVRVVLFVRLREGLLLDRPLIERIKAQIRAGATPRHVPAEVLQVADIPRTKSGKIVELAVTDVLCGRTVRNLDALANPESLDLFRNRPELRDQRGGKSAL